MFVEAAVNDFTNTPDHVQQLRGMEGIMRHARMVNPYMDIVMVDKTVQSPWYIPLLIVAFTSIQGFLNYLSTYMNAWVGGRVTNDLKKTLF